MAAVRDSVTSTPAFSNGVEREREGLAFMECLLCAKLLSVGNGLIIKVLEQLN